VRTADCSDWKKGNVDQRRGTVVQLRKFAGGPVGSSAGIQNGPVLDDGRAYRVLESYCAKYFARGFKLYKLYERAAAPVRPTKVIGICLNTFDLSEAAARAAVERAARDTALPATDPVRFGAAPLVEAIVRRTSAGKRGSVGTRA